MKRRPPIHNLKYLESNRKYLRKNLTPAEAYLWSHLQSKKFHGLKFRRQHSIKNYIVDFYCALHKLVIELDGQVHEEPVHKEKDQKRDQDLTELGFTVLRYENKYVFEELPHVLRDIKNHCGID
ncbi:Very-short-patch-repair endonuclease [Nonlabens sp. Hel1_33_55]|uniref:endonuclease domain-containing protein n=1 Tax=Nonlabens sp. Hel1_33_55 TaxID=1336802 RepID=UPI000875BCE1|nr:endonuclease domain-containing protein [Nonlabens sp. Hel1_33_55]SCY06236.1 Very-short-patch-repair endonuclease [Nonlabens sp. Hel1_33_55]